MSIESKEVKDIYALYQNINEETARERMRKNIERVKNPFGNTTIQTQDGKELKQGDPGFKDALSKARQTVRNAQSKVSGNNNSSSSSSSSSTVVKKETPVVKKETPPAPKLDRESGTPDKRTPPKVNRDEVGSKEEPVVTMGRKSGSERRISQQKIRDERSTTPSIRTGRGQGNRTVVTNPNRQGGEKAKEIIAKKSADAKIDNQVDKYVADRKVPINRDLTIDKSAEGKAKYDAKKAERIAKETPKVATPKVDAPAPKPEKITARTQMRQRNIDRFGADKVNALMDKQKAFKSMQAKSMMPGAKPGAAKAEFAKDFPNSNVAKDLKKSKRVTQVMDLESYDAFDIVLGYLSESGQVDSMDEALYIMMEMDAATIQGIVRDFEMLTEEEADRMKDERLEKYGIGHDGSDRKAGSGGSSDSKKPKGKTNLQKETEKKHGKGKSPLDVAKANIVAKYGKGAIAPSKKKKK